MVKIYLSLLFLLSISMHPQSYAQNEDEKPIPDYRNRINIPDYDPSLMPLNYGTAMPSGYDNRTSTGAWTELNPKVPRVDYLCIDFVGIDTGWAVGANGAIIYTTNGGDEWNTAVSGVNTVLLNVNSYDGKTVIVTGYDGLILRSTDAGKTWTQIPSGVTGDLWRVQMVNDSLGWISGTGSSLLKTTDGGESWQTVTTGVVSNYWSLAFGDENYGYIACDNGKILKTTNGGSSWTELNIGDNKHIYTIELFNNQKIITGGQSGRTAYTTDGGMNWTLSTAGSNINSISFVNDTLGYAVGDGQYWYYRTTDGGISWQWNSKFATGEFCVKFINEEIGYEAGKRLTINKSSDKGYLWEKNILNDNFTDVYFTSEIKGFLIGSDKLYRTNDGGKTLEEVAEVSGGSTIIFINNSTGFIGRTNGIYKTTNGGEDWYLVNGLTGGVIKIFFINQITGWAVGGSNIYKTTDGGENWIIQQTASSFTSIHFVDSLYGWASRINGRPFKTTDGGINWLEQTNLNIWESRDVIFQNYTNGFLLESNKLYKTTDGGTQFNLVSEITGFSVAAQFTSYNDSTIFISGYKIFRSIDGGNTWVDFNELTGIRINSLSLLGIGSGYAVGEMGIVFRYYDETVPVELINFSGLLESDVVFLNWITATESNNKGFLIERKKEEEVNWTNLAFIYGAGTSSSINYYHYNDVLSQSGKYKYRLKQIDYNGQYEFSKEIEIEFKNNLNFYLSQNFPNPFNPITNINFNIPEKTLVRIILYDVTGKEIKKVITEEMEAGFHSVQLNSERISSGVYFYKIITGSGFTAVNKLTIIK